MELTILLQEFQVLETIDFLVPFAGFPIITKSGDLIGGIGISGATSSQDEECAFAAINSKRSLKLKFIWLRKILNYFELDIQIVLNGPT